MAFLRLVILAIFGPCTEMAERTLGRVSAISVHGPNAGRLHRTTISVHDGPNAAGRLLRTRLATASQDLSRQRGNLSRQLELDVGDELDGANVAPLETSSTSPSFLEEEHAGKTREAYHTGSGDENAGNTRDAYKHTGSDAGNTRDGASHTGDKNAGNTRDHASHDSTGDVSHNTRDASRKNSTKAGVLFHPPFLVKDCDTIYLDAYSHNGVQIRKFFEPSEYPGNQLEKHFRDVFDKTARNKSCAIGIEPQPGYFRPTGKKNSEKNKPPYYWSLGEVQRAYNKMGRREVGGRSLFIMLCRRGRRVWTGRAGGRLNVEAM